MELRGERLLLTDIGLEAAAEILPAYNGDAQFNLWRDGRPVVDLEAVRADMLEAKSMPGGMVWRIADHSGALVGVATTAFVPPPHGGWIGLLIIRQEFQGLGLGGEAADLLEEYLFADPDVTQIGLAVQSQNSRALAFWERRGYQRGLHRKQFDVETDTLRLPRRSSGERPS
jgi:RimJ/RimL family protein N-acetyltransferase